MNIKLISKIIILTTLNIGFADASDKFVINGLSKHFNTPLDRNSYNYGLGYSKNNHEVGFYRNSRKAHTSFSIYYSWNKEVKKIGKTSLGYRLGGALYDSAASYDMILKPIVAGYADIPVTNKSAIRISGSYNLVGIQYLVNY